jgi:hypothetical protein
MSQQQSGRGVPSKPLTPPNDACRMYMGMSSFLAIALVVIAGRWMQGRRLSNAVLVIWCAPAAQAWAYA